uniref:Uncharacterized protein n=1 Tax=Paramormyrops kingsleyae TaxID=1676925 RepID=A0A3B3S7F7_9TELE
MCGHHMWLSAGSPKQQQQTMCLFCVFLCLLQIQCERKEEFIQKIQGLDIKTQAAIASCIQEVTQNPSNVLPLQWGELYTLEANELQSVFSSMAQHIQSLLAQRDTHLEVGALAVYSRSLSSAQGAEPLPRPGGKHPAAPEQFFSMMQMCITLCYPWQR